MRHSRRKKTADGKIEVVSALSEVGGLFISVGEFSEYVIRSSFFFDDDPTYDEEERKLVDELKRIVSCQSLVPSCDLDNQEIPAGSIAYFSVDGPVFAGGNPWGFSSKDFARRVAVAESNPNIGSLFLHISSGGGQAWYLDRVAETLNSVSKPIVAHVEQACCSAAYYIGCCADRITAETNNCIVGCIGTMCTIVDFRKFYESIGIQISDLYAEQSDLKNAKIREAFDGSPERFIQADLNPLAKQFIDTVRSARPSLSDLPDDSPILRGEDYLASEALELGLIDNICSIEDSVRYASECAMKHADEQSKRDKAIRYLTNN